MRKIDTKNYVENTKFQESTTPLLDLIIQESENLSDSKSSKKLQVFKECKLDWKVYDPYYETYLLKDLNRSYGNSSIQKNNENAIQKSTNNKSFKFTEQEITWEDSKTAQRNYNRQQEEAFNERVKEVKDGESISNVGKFFIPFLNKEQEKRLKNDTYKRNSFIDPEYDEFINASSFKTNPINVSAEKSNFKSWINQPSKTAQEAFEREDQNIRKQKLLKKKIAKESIKKSFIDPKCKSENVTERSLKNYRSRKVQYCIECGKVGCTLGPQGFKYINE